MMISDAVIGTSIMTARLKHSLAHLEVSLPGVEIDSAVIPARPDGVVYAEEDDHMFAFQLMSNYST